MRIQEALRACAVAALAVAAAPPALAAIGVDQAEVILDAGTTRASLVVSNDGAAPAFVEVTVREILNPGLQPEEANRSADPRAVGLLAAPNRITLAAGERRTLRFETLEAPRDADRVWRVLVREVSGPISGEVSGIAVLLGYDVLVIQRPADPAVDVRATRRGAELTLENKGNTFALLMDGRQCVEGVCTDVAGARIYAGGSRTWTLPEPDAPVEFTLRRSEGAVGVQY